MNKALMLTILALMVTNFVNQANAEELENEYRSRTSLQNPYRTDSIYRQGRTLNLRCISRPSGILECNADALEGDDEEAPESLSSESESESDTTTPKDEELSSDSSVGMRNML